MERVMFTPLTVVIKEIVYQQNDCFKYEKETSVKRQRYEDF